MHHDTENALWVCWQIWTWVAAIGWPLAGIFSSKPQLSDEEKWAIAQEIIQQPTLMPDGTMQRGEIVWRSYESSAAGLPASSVTRPRIVQGTAVAR